MAACRSWGETVPARWPRARSSALRPRRYSSVDGKFWEFLKVFYKTNHVWSSQIVTISNETWKKDLGGQPEERSSKLRQKLEPEFWKVSGEADVASAKRLTEGGQMIVVPRR